MSTRDKIVEYLTKHPSASKADIAEAIQAKVGTTGDALYRMELNGEVRCLRERTDDTGTSFRYMLVSSTLPIDTFLRNPARAA